MSPWKSLYAMIWIVTLEFLLAMFPGTPAWVLWAHYALGIGIVAIAFANFRALRATTAPGRVKRVAKSSVQLATVVAALGALGALGVGESVTLLFGITLWGVVLFLHAFLAFAVLTQAAAIAISYDMWEEKEFAVGTAPGEVPALPGERAKPAAGLAAAGERPKSS